jgi:hypothetical protein
MPFEAGWYCFINFDKDLLSKFDIFTNTNYIYSITETKLFGYVGCEPYNYFHYINEFEFKKYILPNIRKLTPEELMIKDIIE